MSGSVRVSRPSPEELKVKGIFEWDIWEKSKSVFPWVYTNDEHCYVVEGLAVITDKAGRSYTVRKGDYVVFESGFECTWDIQEPFSKRFSFP